MFANKNKLEKQGVDVNEWAHATPDIKKLPEKTKKFSHASKQGKK